MQIKFFHAILAVASLHTLTQAAPARHQRHWNDWNSPLQPAKAIYFLTNDANNAVAAIPVGSDGLLSEGTITLTGGNGGNFLNAPNDTIAAPDALDSQSSLTIAGNFIFAVNAGSNTLSMLSINPSDPTKLTMIGAPVTLPGQFPNSVAASARNRLVCVGTTGTQNGVSCSSFSEQGLSAMDGLRSFDLAQTTPPVGPLNSVSQLFFSEDQSKLFSTVKGDGMANPGFFSVFPVESGKWGSPSSLATSDIRSSPSGTAVLFGSEVIPGTSNVMVSDASFGAAIVAVDPVTNVATTIGNQTITGQGATCWVAISAATGTGFVTDVKVDRLIEMSLEDASIVSILDLSANGDGGLIDIKAAGNFLYALAPNNGSIPATVTVIDVSGGPGTAKQAQHFDLSRMGVDQNAQGMAVF